MIFVGGGAIHAREEILELAEMIDAPVVAFRSGRGIVSNAHELGLTMAAAYRLWPATDLMIGIGTRMELPASGFRWPYQPPGLKSVRIDIDPVEMRRVDIRRRDRRGRKSRHRRSGGGGEKSRPQQDQRPARRDSRGHRGGASGYPEGPAADGLSEHPARGAAGPAIVTDELSQVGFASGTAFRSTNRHLITSGYQGTLGPGFPTALGAKVANPDRPVVAITGDGGFMFACRNCRPP